MHLNADIVFDKLPVELSAKMSGTKVLDLSLGRPRLYEGGGAPFEANQLYLVDANRIPQRAGVGRGCVIVCIGNSPLLERYRKRCCVITTSDDADFYQTFNALQTIFDFYDAWVDDLQSIVDDDANVQHLLERSEEVLGNPLYVIDEDFRMLGIAGISAELSTDPLLKPSDAGSLRLGAFDQFLENHELSMEEREPLVISLLDQTTLNYNLIDEEAYRGCVTVHYTHRSFRPSDKPLIKVLGRAVLNAISKHSLRSPESPGSLRQALQGLVEERPLDSIERGVILGANKGERYVCMRMKRSSRLEQLPLGYVRNAVESAFPRSVVFEHRKNSIVAVLRIGDMDSGAYRQAIAEGVAPFVGSMEMKAGISNPYDDLRSVRSLYLQADAALDMGVLFAPSDSLYFFNDYALPEMVMDMASVHQIDTLLDEGLRKLIEHDANSSTSYVSTLQSFLNNESSVAKTAAELYVHRSTLMERLSRIKRDLSIDLDDSDERLRLQILLKALQVRDELREQGSE